MQAPLPYHLVHEGAAARGGNNVGEPQSEISEFTRVLLPEGATTKR